MQFQNRFWENESLNGWGNSDVPEEIWQPTWDLAGSTGIIMSYLRWTPAEEMDELSEEERINYIISRWENIFPDYKHNFELCDKKSFWNCDTWGFSYDCDSVMHYGKDQFSINGEDTIGKSFF